MPLTSSNNNKTNEYSDKNMEVNNPVQSTKNTNVDVDVDKNLIASTTSSSWENNNSLYQLNNGSGNYLQGGTLLQHQAIYLPLQPQGYYTPLDPFGSLLNQYGGGYIHLKGLQDYVRHLKDTLLQKIQLRGIQSQVLPHHLRQEKNLQQRKVRRPKPKLLPKERIRGMHNLESVLPI